MNNSNSNKMKMDQTYKEMRYNATQMMSKNNNCRDN